MDETSIEPLPLRLDHRFYCLLHISFVLLGNMSLVIKYYNNSNKYTWLMCVSKSISVVLSRDKPRSLGHIYMRLSVLLHIALSSCKGVRFLQYYREGLTLPAFHTLWELYLQITNHVSCRCLRRLHTRKRMQTYIFLLDSAAISRE